VALGAAAGVAVENARLYEAARRQQRWIQASAEVTTRLLSGSDPGEVLAGITRQARELSGADLAVLALPEEDPRLLTVSYAVDAMDETIKDIRATFFALLARDAPAGPDLRGHVVSLVEEMTDVLGFAPSLRLGAGLGPGVSPEAAEQALAALREALSNAARHAQASQVDVTADVSLGGMLTVQVTDNGIGIPADGRRSGLRNLASRAEKLGGELRVETTSPNEVSIRQATPGSRDRISRHTDTPSPSGSRTSRTATSGFSAGMRASAEDAAPASPTTLMSGSASQVTNAAPDDLVVLQEEHRDRRPGLAPGLVTLTPEVHEGPRRP
jgi:hypothetical protein